MTEFPILTITVRSGGALTADRFVTHGGAHPSADAHAVGVARAQATAAGEPVPVTVLGIATIEVGGAISAGAAVKTDAQGRAIAWATSGVKLGIALQAATAAGQRIPVLLTLQAP